MSTEGSLHALFRRSHEDNVLRVLRESGALSRGEIARRVGLSRTTISEITADLLRRRAITVVDTDADRRVGSGRPAERLALDPGSGQFMGIDFGRRRVHVAIADAAHEIIAAGTARYDDSALWPERTSAALDVIGRLTDERGVHYGALQAIGIGVPGWGDQAPREDVAARFAERFRTAVIVDNNVRFASLAEALHAHPDTVGNLVYLRLSDGVGGGLVVGGRLVRGFGGHAGEFGHVTLVAAPDAIACRCGKHGCLETVASVPAILARCRSLGLDVDSLDALRAAVAIAHPIADRVLRDAGTVIGKALGAAAMTLNPAEIVLSGDIVGLAPALLQQITSTVTYELSWLADAVPVIRPALLGDDAGALGAIAALFHESPLLANYPAAAVPRRSVA